MTRIISRALPPLRDRIRPDVRVLFVGINPGMRSALTGHHFAGFSNRFWRLLSDSRLAPEPITYEDDDRLPEWGYGITNIVRRATPGIDTLQPGEYVKGRVRLRAKIRRYRPAVVALVGVTLPAGVITWAWSPIKFQADMGILLTFMFVWNMLGALVLIPALSHFLLPTSMVLKRRG